MKKLLIAVLAFALFAPAFAVENVQITGDIQTIGISMEDPAGDVLYSDYKGITNRVILGIGADLVEDVYARVTFAHENVFGDIRTPTGVPLVSENLDDIWARTRVAEAYVKISNIFDSIEVKVGRQFYGDEKSAVMYFGPAYGYADPIRISNMAGFLPNDELYPSYLSLEGATATYRGEKVTLTAAYFDAFNDSYALDRVSDLSLAGLDLDLNITENIAANAYIYDVKDNGWVGSSFGFWGVKPTLDMDNVKAAVEYTRNYGSPTEGKGWQIKADALVSLETDKMAFTPRVTYLKSEKYFEAFGNYRPGLMFGTILGGGINNVINDMFAGSSNYEILNAGLCMKFASLEKLGFGLDFYTGEVDGTFMGNSWEAKAVYNVNEYVALNLTGAILTNAGHSWKHSVNAVQLGMNVKF